jgi:molecular chaperone GrpE
MPASDTPVPDETGGPVVHDRRRIDPVTGQVRRGKHAASKPAGTTGAGRPGGPGGSAGTEPGGAPDGATGQPQTNEAVQMSEPASSGVGQPGSSEPEGAAPSGLRSEGAAKEDDASPGPQVSELEAQLAERTSDVQRLQAEYANYRKRVDRDRAAVKEQAVAATLSGLLPVLDTIDQARDHGELSGGFKSVADQLHAAVSRLGLVSYGEKGDPFDPKIHEALTHSYSADVTEEVCAEIFQPGYKVGERILRPARVAVAEPATGPDGSSNEASWPSPDEEGN